ncbi:ATP-binding protein [Streptomyces sp. DSM 3412]|uniref:ATP-binding protein n=1 Tax=Streptomyces gottesmaniae TaxID=3075518 RepID=A0ABU2YXR5_9ACTN|nr:ATP-binding protein [Streptomyces sp. DSM 3412]MDT0568746.1 ATP-binding protein [Streptomyces sp. DSM 3412]
MECGLSRAAAALSALFALSWSAFLLLGGTELEPDVRTVAVVFLAQAVVTVVRGVRLRLSRADTGAAVALALLGQAVLAVGGASRLVVGQRCLLTVPAVLLAVLLLPRRAGRCTCLVAIGAQIATSWPADGPAEAVEGVWPVVATAVAGEVLTHLMRAAGDRADRAQRRVRAVRAAAGREEGRREAHRHFQGMLHDEVSTALQAISMPGVPVPRLREAATGAVAALASAPAGPGRDGRTDLAAVVRALRPPTGTALTVEAEGAVQVPSQVAEAAAGAAREALRNVEEHAGARTVRVRLRGCGGPGRPGAQRDEGFALSITDDGAGFAAGELAPSSVGLRRSVMRRMDAVGGSAEVHSTPGRGTTVRLEWRPPVAEPAAEGEKSGLSEGTAEDTAGRMRAAVGDVRRPLAAVCLPFLTVMGVIAAIHTSRSPGTGPLLVWYALLAALTVALLLRADSGIPGPVAGAACAFAVAGALGSFLVLPLSALKDFDSWPIGAVTPLLTLLVIVRPAWEALTALALEQAGIVVLVVTGPPIAPTSGATAAIVLPALFAPALGVIAGLAIGRTVAHLGGVTARAEAARSAALATEAARRAREELHRGRLAHLGEEILPFLAEVGSGRCAPDDPGVRDRARLLAGAVRDEIQLPGVLGRTVRELLAAARRADCAVVIQSDSDDLHPPAFLRLLLTTALTCGPTPREVFLTVNATTGAVRASLVVLPGDERRARALSDALTGAGAGTHAEVTNSATSTWVEADVRAP